ncbi:hypothetical protein HRG_013483 [Hirsutella rhossiliensis]
MPREHPVTVSPEEVRRTLGFPTTRSSASCTIWTASAPKNEPAAVKLNSNIPHTRNSRTTHPETTPRRASALLHPNAAKTLPYKSHAAASDCITETT